MFSVPQSTTSSPIESVARSYLAAFTTGDPDVIAAHVSDDFVNEHTSALGSGCVGRAAYRSRLPGFLRDMSDLRYDIESIVSTGEVVAVFYEMHARWQGLTEISVRGVQRLVVQGAFITHRTDYWDSANFLIQANADAKTALAEFGIN